MGPLSFKATPSTGEGFDGERFLLFVSRAESLLGLAVPGSGVGVFVAGRAILEVFSN